MTGTQLDFAALARAARQVEKDKADLLEVLRSFDNLIRDLVNGKYQTRQGSQALNQIATEFSNNKRQMVEPLTTLAQEIDQAREKAERADSEDAQNIISNLRSDR